MVVTTVNSTHRPKDTELEIKNNSPVFKLWLFSLHLCLPLFGVDSMIRLKLYIRKEDTLLQNMQRCGCNLVGMSLSSQDEMLSQKILQHCSSSCDCTWTPRTIQPLSWPSQHEDPPTPTPCPSSHGHIFIVAKQVRPQPLISYAIAESGWSVVSTKVWFGFRCSTASLTKFMTRLSKAVAWAFSSRSGIKPMLETGFFHEMDSLLVMGWVSSRVYIIL